MNSTNKILITGGTGRLAAELKKHLNGDDVRYVGIEDFDITYPISSVHHLNPYYDLIIHMAAYTDVVKSEIEREKCFQTNAFGTFNLLNSIWRPTPVIYISTEYARNPKGVYAMSKLLGEEVVKSSKKPYLILRTLFKPNPFPFTHAYEDQYTQGDYVDVIAKLLAEKSKTWDRKTSALEYLGTGRKTLLELAKRTRPDVLPNKVSDYRHSYLIPEDYE